MREIFLTSVALAALAAAPSTTTPALAGSPYRASGDAERTAPAVQRRAGHFTCSYNEQRTKLERKNCGGVRS